MNAPSYDILQMAEYHRQFKYLPFDKRKADKDYKSMNEVRKILDYPYWNSKMTMDQLFVNSAPEFIKKDRSAAVLYRGMTYKNRLEEEPDFIQHSQNLDFDSYGAQAENRAIEREERELIRLDDY